MKVGYSSTKSPGSKARNIFLQVINSSLFQLHQNSAAVLWMQKHDWLVVSTNFGLFGEWPYSSRFHRIHGGMDIINLDADMMHAAHWIFLQETSNWRVFSKRVEQLNFRVIKFHENCCYAVCWKVLLSRNFRLQHVPIECGTGFEIGNGVRNVVKFAQLPDSFVHELSSGGKHDLCKFDLRL